MDRDGLKRIFTEGTIFFRDERQLDEATFADYGKDRTKEFSATSSKYEALAFPKTTKEIVDIINFACKEKIALVSSGGRTGLSAGALAGQNEIVISLSRMNRLIDFDPYIPALKVESGMTTGRLQEEARSRGLFFPVDFAASGSSTVGGNIATNAGGIHVIRYGMIRNWTAGFTAVTGRGEIINFEGGILKNNSGYDLKHLIIGSEGTLAIITEATMRLTTPPGESAIILFALSGLNKCLLLLENLQNSRVEILACEFFDRRSLDAVIAHLSLAEPFTKKYYFHIILEYKETDIIKEDNILNMIQKLSETDIIEDAVLPQSSMQVKKFWSYREGISESLSMMYTVHKNDVSLPLKNMRDFLDQIEQILKHQTHKIDIAIFGHLGDGNLHLNLLKPDSLQDEEFFAQCRRLDEEIYGTVQKFNGSISGEHGIGLIKKDYLKFSRSRAEIRIMKEIKKVFDPVGILNPGKVLPD